MDDQMLHAANGWLKSHERQTMLIRKEEQGDLDDVQLTLDRIAVRPSNEAGDDYTDGEALLLQGTGTILNGNEAVPLPQNTFVIPVTGLKNVQSDSSKLTLETERARYSIHIQPKGSV